VCFVSWIFEKAYDHVIGIFVVYVEDCRNK
jgi:hypothetical protein